MIIVKIPSERLKIVGVEIPASGRVAPLGVGETADILDWVGVGVLVGVGVDVGLAPPLGDTVGVGVLLGVGVGVTVFVGICVGVADGNFVSEKDNVPQDLTGGFTPQAIGWLSGVVGATGDCLSL